MPSEQPGKTWIVMLLIAGSLAVCCLAPLLLRAGG